MTISALKIVGERIVNPDGDGFVVDMSAVDGLIPEEKLETGAVTEVKVEAKLKLTASGGKLAVDQISASPQVTASVNTGTTGYVNGDYPSYSSFSRITWFLIITINSVDYACTFYCEYKTDGSGTTTVVSDSEISAPPAGITIAASVDPSNAHRLAITNASGYTASVYSHYSVVRQVK